MTNLYIFRVENTDSLTDSARKIVAPEDINHTALKEYYKSQDVSGSFMKDKNITITKERKFTTPYIL